MIRQPHLQMAKPPDLFKDAKGDYYTRGAVVWKDIDTPGPQFAGWVTLASCRNDNCIDHWVRVEPVKGKLIVPHIPRPKPKKLAVLEVFFRGKWTAIHDITDAKPLVGFWEMTVSESICQIRIRYCSK